MSGEDRQRIDKWLWFARVVKTRSLAQDLAESGRVRINGRKIGAAAQPVRRGDVLTIGLGGRVYLFEVLGLADRRGSYPQARLLYADRSEVPFGSPTGADDAQETDEGAVAAIHPAPHAAAAERSADALGGPTPLRGGGRPTKRDRRRLDRTPG